MCSFCSTLKGEVFFESRNRGQKMCLGCEKRIYQLLLGLPQMSVSNMIPCLTLTTMVWLQRCVKVSLKLKKVSYFSLFVGIGCGGSLKCVCRIARKWRFTTLCGMLLLQEKFFFSFFQQGNVGTQQSELERDLRAESQDKWPYFCNLITTFRSLF